MDRLAGPVSGSRQGGIRARLDAHARGSPRAAGNRALRRRRRHPCRPGARSRGRLRRGSRRRVGDASGAGREASPIALRARPARGRTRLAASSPRAPARAAPQSDELGDRSVQRPRSAEPGADAGDPESDRHRRQRAGRGGGLRGGSLPVLLGRPLVPLLRGLELRLRARRDRRVVEPGPARPGRTKGWRSSSRTT